MLFVHPDEQARGLGRALLDAVLPADDDPATLATCTDAAQPISNALYARRGIVPRVPVLELVGRPDRAAPPSLPGDVRSVPFELLAAGPTDGPGPRRLAAALEALDRATLGYAHPQDHAYLRETGRLGHLYEAGTGGSSATGTPRMSGGSGRWPWRTRRSFPASSGTSCGPSSRGGPSRPGCRARPVTP